MKKVLKLKACVGGFCLTALILLTAFAAGEMFPFGWGTVSWCDMNQQLIPLYCDFKDILAGEKSLFLNLANAGGMNFYGVFFFFLSSPFTFLVALVEKTDIPFLMNILVVLKLSVAAFTAAFTFERLCKKISWGVAAALGSMYSLCGYGMLFYQNIMWLDMMYLFPLIILGCCRLIEENRPLMLTVCLTLAVIFNFYISFMIFLFVILFFGAFALFYKNTDKRIYVNLGLSGVLSLLCSAFVWIPCLLQYFSSARGNSFLEELKIAEFYAPYETTLTVLLCSGIIFAGLIFILPRLSAISKESRLLCLVFFLCALPLVIEPVNLMWHTGSYMSFPARYGFIPVFLGILIVGKEYPSTNKKGKNIAVPLSLGIALLGIFALLFTEKNVDTLSSYVNTLWGNRASLKGQAFICLIFTLCYLSILIFLKNGNLRKNMAAWLLVLVIFCEVLCSTQIFMLSAKDRLSLYNYQSVVSLESKAEKQGFYRVNTTHKLTEANMTGAAGFNSISHYTSLNDQIFMEAARLLGYSGYWMETGNWGGSILSDSLLSVGYTIEAVDNGFALKENPYYLGLGIKTEGEIPQKLSQKDRLLSLGDAFAKMTERENPVVKYSPFTTTHCSVTTSRQGYCINNVAEVGKIHYSLKIEEKQALYFDCYNGFSTRLNESINQSFSVSVNGEIISESYPTQSFNGLLPLGSFERDVVDITIEVFNTVDCSSFGVFGVKENIVKDFTTNANTLNLKAEGGKITGEAKQGCYFIALPYNKNYNITLDGEKLEFSKALSGFVTLDIPNSGQLKITLTPKGLYVGIGITILGIVLLVLLKNAKWLYKESIKNIIYGIFIAGCGVVTLWVYIIPVIVNLWDLSIY